jgi:hypothetical protein
MTDLDQNRRMVKVCRCGSHLPRTPTHLRLQRDEERYCSQFCYEQDVRAVWVSAPVFVAPTPLNLRDHLLSELSTNA